jgi:hypothetical protein
VRLPPNRQLAPGQAIRRIFSAVDDGSIRWKAWLPGSDCFTRVACQDGRIEADTWEGWRVDIDPASGHTTNRRFTK